MATLHAIHQALTSRASDSGFTPAPLLPLPPAGAIGWPLNPLPADTGYVELLSTFTSASVPHLSQAP